MKFFVEGLLKTSPGESQVRRVGEYDSLEEAIASAERVIGDFLASKVEPQMTAQQLFSIYKDCGEVPFIFQDSDRTLNVPEFNHFKLAMLRCNNMCPQPFPALLSDHEFELVQQQQRVHAAHTPHDRLDTTEYREETHPAHRRVESLLEQRYAYVAARIVAMWPSDKCAKYIRLIMSDRALCADFPQEVIDDLFFLYEINARLVQEAS